MYSRRSATISTQDANRIFDAAQKFHFPLKIFIPLVSDIHGQLFVSLTPSLRLYIGQQGRRQIWFRPF